MRIFLVCLQSPRRYGMSPYHFWRDYFSNGLTEAGHTVLESTDTDWARGLLYLTPAERVHWRAEIWERTLASLRREQAHGGVDLFLTYLAPGQIETGAVQAVRSLGIPCVNFFCDNLREYRHLPPEFAPFDLHWVPEHGAQALYVARGWKFIHAPMPCWIHPERRTLSATETAVVSFVGSKDLLRQQLLAATARAGLPLEIRGGGWSHDEASPKFAMHQSSPRERFDYWSRLVRVQGWAAAWRRATVRFRPAPGVDFDFTPFVKPSPPADAYQQIVAESAVSLGINRFPTYQKPADQISTYSRLRDIEAPMLGACYLTEWTEGLDLLYEPGTEIETYRDAAELAAKAQALLADPTRRRRMRAAAQHRALTDHSIGQSLARITAQLGLAARPSA